MAVDVFHHGLRRWRIKPYVMNTYLPAMAYGPTVIHLDTLARKYSVSRRIPEDDAYNALAAVFQCLKHGDITSVIPNLENRLQDLLRKRRNDSLAKLRRHFITIAHLARDGQSMPIADCLIQFFMAERDIIADDDRRNLDDWAHAIHRIERLMPPEARAALNFLARRQNEAAYFRPRRYDPWDDDYYDRGRQPHRFDPWHRSRTMPPVYRAPVPRIAAQNFLALPAPGMMTRFPSPGLYAANDPMRDAEMDDMKVHQQVLEDKLNQLAFNQQELAEEVQDPYAPRLLGWTTS